MNTSSNHTLSRHLVVSLIVILLIGQIQTSFAQIFLDVTDETPINVIPETSVFGNGVSFHDFNQDGWDDLSFALKNESPKFYINNEGSFTPHNLGITGNFGDVKSIIWVDFDNDGDKDLFTTARSERIRLYENLGDLEFIDITSTCGFLDEISNHYGSSWGDFNNDGFLDLYVCKYYDPGQQSGYLYTNRLYQNLGNGTFSEISFFANVGNGIKPSFQSVWLDYNLDGWQDIFVINDRLDFSNTLYENQGNGSFVDVTVETGMEIYMDAMSISCCDYDNDEDIDIYITNEFELGNHLMKNTDQVYSNEGTELGLEVNDISWGALWIDYNSDMLNDLYVCTVGNQDGNENPFFKQIENHEFENATIEAGLANIETRSYSVAIGDFNNDRNPDMVQNNHSPYNAQLFKTSNFTNASILIELEGQISNKDGIGSWIKVYSEGIVQTKYSLCGANYLGQDSQRIHFGLGNSNQIDSISIDWLSGVHDVFYNLPVDSTFHIIEGSSITTAIDAPFGFLFCQGDSVRLEAEQAQNYSWNTGDSTSFIYVSEPGEYYLTSMNQDGLELNSEIVSVDFFPEVDYDVISTNPSCFGGSDGNIEITNFDPSIIEGITWNTGDQSVLIEELPDGEYIYWLLDVNECVTFGSVTLSHPSEFEALVNVTDVTCNGLEDGQVVTALTGGTEPYSIDWMGIDPFALAAGNYEILCIDSLGCELLLDFEVEEPEPLEIELTFSGITDITDGIAEVNISGGTEPYLIDWGDGFQDESTIENLPEGLFTVIVTDTNECTDSVNFTITSIPDLKHEVSVYPNPFESAISFSQYVSDITISDLNGRELMNSNELTKKIDLTQLSAGLYILKFSTNHQCYVWRIQKI